jgi:hypothetical protein
MGFGVFDRMNGIFRMMGGALSSLEITKSGRKARKKSREKSIK